MKKNQSKRLPGFFLLAVATIMFLLAGPLAADEGMWTLDNMPRKQLKEKYGFEPSPAWLEHIRLASVRVGDGGSGSFVRPNGLVLTNHHVALGQLQKVSTPQKNYVADGFYAATPAMSSPAQPRAQRAHFHGKRHRQGARRRQEDGPGQGRRRQGPSPPSRSQS